MKVKVATRDQIVDYIRDLVAELGTMAKAARVDTLAFTLGLAGQAAKELQEKPHFQIERLVEARRTLRP